MKIFVDFPQVIIMRMLVTDNQKQSLLQIALRAKDTGDNCGEACHVFGQECLKYHHMLPLVERPGLE